MLRTAQLRCRMVQKAPSRSSALFRPLDRSQLCRGVQYRIFTTGGGPLNKQNVNKLQSDKKTAPGTPNVVGVQTTQKNNAIENVKPASKKPDEIGENNITAKQQRKVDWAIMKEMAKYLWPKVSRISLRKDSIQAMLTLSVI